MRKHSYLYIIGEQILFAITYVWFFLKCPTRFSSTSVFTLALPINLGILLARFTFLLTEKYKQKYGEFKVQIARIVFSTCIISFSIFVISFFEPISPRTFSFFVLTAVMYLSVTNMFVRKFHIESSDIEIDDVEETPPTIQDYFDIVDDISLNFELAILQEHSKVAKNRTKHKKYYSTADLELSKEEIKRETELVIKIVKYIDACSEEFKKNISSYERFQNTQSVEIDKQTTENKNHTG